MMNSIRSIALPAGIQSNHEVLAFDSLQDARRDFKELVNTTYESEKITIGSDSEIISFMHWFEEEKDDLPFQQQEEIWAHFQQYQQAFESYTQAFSGETADSTLEKLRKIDPQLVGEERFQKDDFWIVQRVKSLFHQVMRWASSDETIARYQKRMTVLGPQLEREQQTQKVFEIFPKFFTPTRELTTLQEIDKALGRIDHAPEIYERKAWFERYLKVHVNADLDSLMQRELTPPEESVYYGFSSDSEWDSDEEFFSFDPFEDETPEVQALPLTQWEGAEGIKVIEATIHTTLSNNELGTVVCEKLLPLEQISLVKQHDEDPFTYDITFNTPLVGTTDNVENGGWGDIAHSPLFISQTVTMRFDISQQRILFPEGGVEMGIHLEDLNFLYNKMSYLEGTALSSFLKLHGYVSNWTGKMNYPLQLATTVRGIEVTEKNELSLLVSIHDKGDLPMPKEGVYPTEGCLNALQSQLTNVDLTTSELQNTFSNFTWKPESQ